MDGGKSCGHLLICRQLPAAAKQPQATIASCNRAGHTLGTASPACHSPCEAPSPSQTDQKHVWILHCSSYLLQELLLQGLLACQARLHQQRRQ
jgi:hypothetical protein